MKNPTPDNKVPMTSADRAAVYSLLLASVTPLVAYLLALLAIRLAAYLHATSKVPHPAYLPPDLSMAVIFWLAMATETVAFGLGVFSLFKKRTRPASLWMALLGTLISGAIFGLMVYVVHDGICG